MVESSIDKVSNDVLNLIFGLVSKRDAYQCMLVWKKWKRPAEQRFLRAFRLTSRSIEYLSKKLVEEVTWTSRYTYTTDYRIDIFGAEWIRTLVIDGNLNEDLVRLNLTLEPLLFMARRLNVLEFASLSHLTAYQVKILSIFGNREIALHHIEDFTFSTFTSTIGKMNMEEAKLYCALCFKLRSSIKKLYLTHAFYGFSINNSSVTRSSRFLSLSQFDNLAHLVIENFQDSFGDGSIVPFWMINQCVNLISFGYHSDLDMPETNAFLLYTSLMNSRERHQHQNLNCLTLTIPTITRSFMGYIINFVQASRLKQIYLRMTNLADTNALIASQDDSMFAQLLNHVKTASRLSIYINQGHDHEVEPNHAYKPFAKAGKRSFGVNFNKIWDVLALIFTPNQPMTANMDIYDKASSTHLNGNNSQLSLIRRGDNDGGLTVNYSIGSDDTTFFPHGLQSTRNIMAAPTAYEGQLHGLTMNNFSIRINSKISRDINATVPLLLNSLFLNKHAFFGGIQNFRIDVHNEAFLLFQYNNTRIETDKIGLNTLWLNDFNSWMPRLGSLLCQSVRFSYGSERKIKLDFSNLHHLQEAAVHSDDVTIFGQICMAADVYILVQWSSATVLYQSKLIDSDGTSQEAYDVTGSTINYNYQVIDQTGAVMELFEKTQCISFDITFGVALQRFTLVDMINNITTTFTPPDHLQTGTQTP